MPETQILQRRHVGTKNAVFVLLVVLTNTIGNVLLALGMNAMPDLFSTSLAAYAWTLFANVNIIGGTALLIVSLFAQLSLYSWADLSYVLPMTASAYVVTAILSKFVLHEQISLNRWAGVTLISFGVLLVSKTPVRTKPARRGVR